MNKYDDIINLDRPKSKHPQMSLYDRAAQFAPFAALTGYGDAINEVGRTTDKKINLSEEEKDNLNDKLNYIIKNIKENLNTTITYFQKDERKEGGRYITISNKIKKIDSYNKNIIFIDKTTINIDDIIYIEIKND